MSNHLIKDSIGPIMGPAGSAAAEKLKSVLEHPELVKTLERNINALRSRASDVGEEVTIAERSGTKKRKLEVGTWLEEVRIITGKYDDLMKRLGFLDRLWNEVAHMNTSVEKFHQQSLGFGELCLTISKDRGWKFRTPKFFGEENLKTIKSIWDCLFVEKVSIIGIHGMAGVGKTILMQHIYNYLLVTTDDPVYWLTVSKGSNIHTLQTKIAGFLGLDISNEDNEDIRAAKLSEELSRKDTFFLVLDDARECLPLEKIGDPLRVPGFRVIVTTQQESLCSGMGCQRDFPVNPLNKNEAWDLFKDTLGRPIPETVESTAKSMVEKCGELPLAIVALAASMRRIKHDHEWRNASVELNARPMETHDMESKVYPVLLHSYDNLSDPVLKSETLQKCFLYCCLFPEDERISRDELINKFIREGILERRNNRQAEFDQGHSILDRLEDARLLENAGESFEKGKCVKMHDVFRDMAIRITKDKDNHRFMVRAGLSQEEVPDDEEWEEDLDKVSLMRNNISVIPERASPNCPRLSTLLLQKNYLLKSIPESFLKRMSSLKVLNLRDNRNLKELPESLSGLILLTALLLRGCRRLTAMPSLPYSLEHLDISKTAMKQVPDGIGSSRNLKVLDMEYTDIKMIPPGLLAGLSRLQRLVTPDGVCLEVQELLTLPRLEELRGNLCGTLLDFNRLIKSKEKKNNSHLWSYSIAVSGTIEHTENDKPQRYIHGSSENGVVLSNYQLEERDEVSLPQCIQALKINSCNGIGGSLLGKFHLLNARALRVFRIRDCEDTECILRLCCSSSSGTEPLIAYEGGCSTDDVMPFRYTEVLCLSRLPKLSGLYKWEASPYANGRPLPQATFSCIKELYIYQCHSIKKLLSPLLLQRLLVLEILWVKDCNAMEEIITDVDDKEGDAGSSSDKPATEMIDLPYLKSLEVARLPELSSICKGKMSCNQIENITVSKLPKIKRFPLFLPLVDGRPTPPHALKEILMLTSDEEWWNSMEWYQPNAKDVLQPFLNIVRSHGKYSGSVRGD